MKWAAEIERRTHTELRKRRRLGRHAAREQDQRSAAQRTDDPMQCVETRFGMNFHGNGPRGSAHDSTVRVPLDDLNCATRPCYALTRSSFGS